MATRQLTTRWAWMVFAVTVGLFGCSETVSVLTIQLSLPPGYNKGFKCAGDPRWSHSISIKASCDEGRTQSSFVLEKGGTITLYNIPLGECTVEVETANVHGRTVLAGEADVTLVEGKDEDLKITLLPEPCREPNCDSDRDGLYITDEKGLKTSPKSPDTDGDGLYDGVEVAFCCSDPLKKNKSGECSLSIQHMSPALGVVRTMVKLSATDALKSPSVILGEVPMESLLTDATDVHGKVGKGALLGDVILTSGGIKSQPYVLMFATLEREVSTLVELQIKANTTSGLMHDVVDMVYHGKMLLMLGRATASWSSKNPMLLIMDRGKGTHHRVTVPVAGVPVALAASAKQLAVLLRDAKSQGILVVLGLSSTGKLGVTKKIDLKYSNPVDVEMDPRGDAVVLFKGHLARVPLVSGPAGMNVTVRAIPGPTLNKSPVKPVQPACTGLALHRPPSGALNTWTAYAACNMPSVLCPNNKKCPPRATLVKVASMTKCLTDTVGTTTANCFSHFQSGGVALGAPVVSEKTKTIYVLTNKGIVGAGMLNNPGIKTKLLIPKVLAGWSDKVSRTDLMAADAKGRLFVVPTLQDRARMLRTDPDNKEITRRRGRPFVVGEKGEEGLMMKLHPDGSVLDVIQRAFDGSQGLTSVCLKRCKDCVCSK